jgi:hypothetical protein
MREVACGPKEEPYNLWLGAELLIDLRVRRVATTLMSPRFRNGEVHGTAVHTVPDYMHHIMCTQCE